MLSVLYDSGIAGGNSLKEEDLDALYGVYLQRQGVRAEAARQERCSAAVHSAALLVVLLDFDIARGKNPSWRGN